MPRSKSNQPIPIPAPEFDAKFDAGDDISEHLDFSAVRMIQPEIAPQKVNVDFPAWVVTALDKEADRIGIPRQSLIKVWIVERLEKLVNYDMPQNEGALAPQSSLVNEVPAKVYSQTVACVLKGKKGKSARAAKTTASFES